eukprot:1448826-Prymnesium_polylepis.1
MRSRALRPLPGALARAGHVTTGRERSGTRLAVCAGRSRAQTAHRKRQWQPTWPQPARARPPPQAHMMTGDKTQPDGAAWTFQANFESGGKYK